MKGFQAGVYSVVGDGAPKPGSIVKVYYLSKDDENVAERVFSGHVRSYEKEQRSSGEGVTVVELTLTNLSAEAVRMLDKLEHAPASNLEEITHKVLARAIA